MRLPFEKPIESRFAWRPRRPAAAICFLALTSAIGTPCIHAQEAVRYSLSRQEITRLPPPPIEPSFITLGPFRGQMDLGAGVFFDDNANLANRDTQSEVWVNQSLDLDLHWLVTYLNEINLRVGATLSEILGGHDTRLRLSIHPGTNVEFKIFAGDFLIRLHNYLTVLQDPTQDPAAANRSTLSQLTNDAGISVDWILGKIILTGRFDYSYSADLSSSNTAGSRNTFRPGLAASFAMTPDMQVGLDLAYSKSSLAGINEMDINALAVGPFLRGHLTHWITVDLAGGLYVIDAPKTRPTNYYLSFNVRHQLTRTLQYGVSFTRDLDFSTDNELTENNNFTLDGRWDLRPNLSLGTNGFVNFGQVLTGSSAGNFVQYGMRVALDWMLSRKITASVGYRFVERDADIDADSYKQNRVDFNLSYKF